MVRSLHDAAIMQAVPRVIALLLVLIAACINDPIVASRPDAGSGQPDARPSGPSANDLVREWSGCMTLDNFKLANMATAWGGLAAANGQACSSCHGTGLYGFYADRDELAMFTAISGTKGFLLTMFSPDVANKKMIVNELTFQSVSKREGHPPFEPKNNAGMTALRSFYDITLTKQLARTCDPPRVD